MTYTPAYGCHGMTRKAGPLIPDTKEQIVKNDVTKGTPLLKNEKISLDAAERSAEKQLALIRAKKEAWNLMQDQKDKAKGGYLPENDLPASKVSSTAAPPEMSSTPGRKAVRRPAEMGSEEKEYYLRRGGDEEEWSQVSEVVHSTP